MPRKPIREPKRRQPSKGQAEAGVRSAQDTFAKILAKVDPQDPKRRL